MADKSEGSIPWKGGFGRARIPKHQFEEKATMVSHVSHQEASIISISFGAARPFEIRAIGSVALQY